MSINTQGIEQPTVVSGTPVLFETSNRRLNLVLLVCFVAMSLLGYNTANPLLTSVGILIPFLQWRLLWQSGQPAVLFFGALFQWLQSYSPILSANSEGKTLTEIFGGPELEYAAWLSLASVVVLSLGMYAIIQLFSRRSSELPKEFVLQSARFDVKRLFYAYFVAAIFGAVISYVANRSGGLRQPLLGFAIIKWVPIFLIAWVTFQHKRRFAYLGVVTAIEIVVGFGGYFSSFKSILFVLIIVGLGTLIGGRNLRIGQLAIMVLVCAVLSLFWQAVKSDYRAFLNQGSGMQVVDVPVFDRFEFLVKAALEQTPESLLEGAESGILRLGYIEYFALSIEYVPNRIPHQDGELWLDAIKHTLLPRLFYPDKKVIDESQRTRQFTGVRVAGVDEGTSISLGYPTESYIDFGFPLMFIPIFLLGAMYAVIYFIFTRAAQSLCGAAFATSLLLEFVVHLAASNISIVGGIATGFIALFLCAKFVLPMVLPYLLLPARASMQGGAR